MFLIMDTLVWLESPDFQSRTDLPQGYLPYIGKVKNSEWFGKGGVRNKPFDVMLSSD